MTLEELETAVSEIVPAGWYWSVTPDIEHHRDGTREETWRLYACGEAANQTVDVYGANPDSALEQFREEMEGYR